MREIKILYLIYFCFSLSLVNGQFPVPKAVENYYLELSFLHDLEVTKKYRFENLKRKIISEWSDPNCELEVKHYKLSSPIALARKKTIPFLKIKQLISRFPKDGRMETDILKEHCIQISEVTTKNKQIYSIPERIHWKNRKPVKIDTVLLFYEIRNDKIFSISKAPDQDGDLVPDILDKCLKKKGFLCTNGCPDGDGDCVRDSLDKCPGPKGTLKNEGCPNSDDDPLYNNKDECPNDPGPLCTNGCPDKDNDCVSDSLDICPNITGDISLQGCIKELPFSMKPICDFSIYSQENITSLYTYGNTLFSGGSRGTLKMYSLKEVNREKYKLLNDLDLEGKIESIVLRDTNTLFIQNEINGHDKVREVRISKRKKLRRSKEYIDSTFVGLEILGYDKKSKHYIFNKDQQLGAILWDPLQKKNYSLEGDDILAVQFLENDSIMTIDHNGLIKYRDYQGNADEKRNVYLLENETMSRACFSKDGRKIAAATAEGIKCWQSNEGQFQSLSFKIPEEKNSISAMTFSDDGSILLIGDGDKSARLRSYHLDEM